MIESFETERLTAERLRADHVDELEVMHTDPIVMATLSGTRTSEQTRQFLRDSLDHWEKHGYGLWIFRDKVDGRFVGRAGIRHVEIEGKDEVELAYGLMAEYWRRGLGTEIARALLTVAFEGLGLEELICFTLHTNLGSQRVMQKVGFVYERDIIHANLPHVVYRLNAASSKNPPESPPNSQ